MMHGDGRQPCLGEHFVIRRSRSDTKRHIKAMTSTSVRFASRAAMRSHVQMTLIHLRSVLALACLAHLALPRTALGAEFIVYFGTGGRESKGIYASRLDSKSGKLGPPELAAEVRPPSFVAL